MKSICSTTSVAPYQTMTRACSGRPSRQESVSRATAISNLLRTSSDTTCRFSLSRSDFTTAHLHVTPVFQMDSGVLRTPLSSGIGISNDDDFEPPEDVERRDVSVFTIQIRLYNSPPSRYSGLLFTQSVMNPVVLPVIFFWVEKPLQNDLVIGNTDVPPI
ncbi:hypothetical protein EDD17DRAFT_33525 [Pisolithus thermaeus]|nr:hypothetical protein EDD17DRAFT_33525 [Pisolithus thermaeus]